MSTPLPPALRSKVFTTAEALRAGLTERQLRGPYVRRLFHGVYVAADREVDEVVRVRAALRVLPPDTLVTGVTALRWLGAPVDPAPLQFCSEHPHPIDRAGLRVTLVKTLPPAEDRIVSPEHAFVSAARHLDLVELVAAGDWLVRKILTSRASLTSYAARYRGHGARHARRAAGLVRDRVDSVRETRLRLCLVLAGLPEPDCNLTVMVGDLPLGKPDLSYWKYRVLLEYEGDHHRTDRNQWNVDILRFEEFSAEGWESIRVTAVRMRRPRDLVLRVHRALVARGYEGPAPSFSEEWRAIFETLPERTSHRLGQVG